MPETALDRDRAPVQLRYLLGDGQTQAEAAAVACAVRSVEALKNPGEILLGNADAVLFKRPQARGYVGGGVGGVVAVEQPVPSQSAQIGDKVVIRLDTARQEQPPVSVEPGVRLAIQQIVPESQVSFGLHTWKAPIAFGLVYDDRPDG